MKWEKKNYVNDASNGAQESAENYGFPSCLDGHCDDFCICTYLYVRLLVSRLLWLRNFNWHAVRLCLVSIIFILPVFVSLCIGAIVSTSSTTYDLKWFIVNISIQFWGYVNFFFFRTVSLQNSNLNLDTKHFVGQCQLRIANISKKLKLANLTSAHDRARPSSTENMIYVLLCRKSYTNRQPHKFTKVMHSHAYAQSTARDFIFHLNLSRIFCAPTTLTKLNLHAHTK